MFMFMFYFFEVPSGVLKKLNAIGWDFCSSMISTNRSIDWQNGLFLICQPKDHGGLGIQNNLDI